MQLAIVLHLLSAVIWVGGMFFAFLILRPAAYQLEVPLRLKLWNVAFKRFFFCVWISIIALLFSGYWMVFRLYGGMSGLMFHINLMQGIGIFMMMIFMHVYFSPYRRLKKALATNDHEKAMKQLQQIRSFVLLNLLLGILTIIIASAGRYGLFL